VYVTEQDTNPLGVGDGEDGDGIGDGAGVGEEPDPVSDVTPAVAGLRVPDRLSALAANCETSTTATATMTRIPPLRIRIGSP
jgi:hypothetical protein